jgi:hypothetical protein
MVTGKKHTVVEKFEFCVKLLLLNDATKKYRKGKVTHDFCTFSLYFTLVEFKQ